MQVSGHDLIGKTYNEARETFHSGKLYMCFVLRQPFSCKAPLRLWWGDVNEDVGYLVDELTVEIDKL
jgi:hypothetical protein